MKRLVIAAIILGTLIIGVSAAQTEMRILPPERATVEFTETVKLRNVFLKGEFFIMHDDEKMASGEDCIYVYDRAGKLVVSFHCTPVERPKAKSFRMVATRRNLAYSPAEVLEIQFAGSTEAHLVPSL